MKRRTLGSLTAIIALVVAAIVVGRLAYLTAMNGAMLRAAPDLAPQNVSLARFAESQAKGVYSRTCASCHGADMRGDPKTGAPNLIDSDWLYGEGGVSSIEQTIAYGIRAGHPRSHNLANMPAFAQPDPYFRYKMQPLTPGQISDVTEFLFQMEKREPVNPDAAARGSLVYAQTGDCFDCHTNDGGGDDFIGAPNLRDNIWLYGDGSKASIRRAIEKGLAGACPAWIGKLKPAAIRALAIYIHDRAAAGRPTATTAAQPAPRAS